MTTEEGGPDIDRFMTAARGRFPLSAEMSSATVWSATSDGIPQPDKHLSTLKWLNGLVLPGLLGIDHFYLRSPWTGLMKMLTVGGLGLWWLWDTFQVFTEGDRVEMYGMTAPFDLKTGIGQGMITAGPTHYEQRSSFSWWQAAAIFSFLGADCFLLGQWGKGARKITELALFLAFLIPVLSAYDGHIGSILSFGKLISLVAAAYIGLIIGTEWFLVVSQTFTAPQELFNRGIQVNPKEAEMLNAFRPLIENLTFLSEETRERIIRDMSYISVNGKELLYKFQILHRDPAATPEELAAQEEESESSETRDGTWNWLISYLVLIASPFLFIGYLIMKIFQYGARAIKYFFLPELAVVDIQAAAATKVAEEAYKKATGEPFQYGGGRKSEQTLESVVLGGTVAALAGAGALKFLVDYLMAEK
jgi:hypothetical protein